MESYKRDGTDPWTEEEKRMVAGGEVIAAIKSYRNRTDATLKATHDSYMRLKNGELLGLHWNVCGHCKGRGGRWSKRRRKTQN